MNKQTILRLTVRVAFFFLLGWLLSQTPIRAASPGTIHQDISHKVVTMADGQGHLALRLNYDHRCTLDQVIVRGRQVVSPSGVSSGVRLNGHWYSTKLGIPTPKVAVSKNIVKVDGISFGKPGSEVQETWKFTVQPNQIVWRITRRYLTSITLEDTAFPEWDFNNMTTWTGGILGNGGVVWNKYLDTPNATYGAHTGAVTFWNPQQNDCLRIIPALPKGYNGAVRFSHQPADANQQENLSFNYTVSPEGIKPKYDLRRFLGDRQDLWAPFQVQPSQVSVEFSLQALDDDQAYNRGTFQGVDGKSIRELLNTVGRYGVIDHQLIGANGWRTGYICLHEQWFGQIGLALDDPDYTRNLASTLDYERDHAIGSDGRVLARWTYDAGDAMPGTYNAQGFYEAQWGYLLDSQPDYVINVAEQFDLTDDRKWLAGQKVACERALDYLLRREVQNTGLVSVLTDSHNQHQGSDWLDITWASYQNALVNAELYYALGLWADSEDSLGDHTKAAHYRAFAARLKTSFNKPISEGGFWDPTNQWYAYWRDKDGSIHGNNLCTPVNFAAISYGICDAPARKKAILDRIEAEVQKEKLFAWPINMFTFAPGEASDRNYPFPNYENGSIFMSWGELGVRAYAGYDPNLAVKYVKKTLARYQTDGLSFQRYERNTQEGAGDDILAGNCMTIVGLYRDIYGIQPKPNHLCLDPHLTSELNGTNLRYQLRGQSYVINLSTKSCAVTNGSCTLRGSAPFGVHPTSTELEYFPGLSSEWALSVTRPKAQRLTIQIETWPTNPKAPRQWTASTGNISFTVAHLLPNEHYTLHINGKRSAVLRTDQAGRITFTSTHHASAMQKFELRLIRG